MNKAELIQRVSDSAGLTRSDAEAAVRAVTETIEEALKCGETVTFTGFGRFSVSDRAARQGVNPRTGEPMSIAASKAPRFTPGAGLKQSVRVGAR
jgi:DNA-binding protein HU-beta